MDLVMRILASVVAPSILVYIGWRGIKPGQRAGALRVIFAMVGVIVAGTAVYIVVITHMTPKWVAADCTAAYAELSPSDFPREPFLAACNDLSESAAQCTRPSFAKKFPDGCRRYLGEIHAKLPKLDLGIASQSKR